MFHGCSVISSSTMIKSCNVFIGMPFAKTASWSSGDSESMCFFIFGSTYDIFFTSNIEYPKKRSSCMNFMSGEGMPPMQEHDMDVTQFSEDP